MSYSVRANGGFVDLEVKKDRKGIRWCRFDPKKFPNPRNCIAEAQELGEYFCEMAEIPDESPFPPKYHTLMKKRKQWCIRKQKREEAEKTAGVKKVVKKK